jgi:hypothetical protein
MRTYIKNFYEFINEALKDEIPLYMSDIIKKRHGDKYLDFDIPKHTDNIPNCKIEVKNENITKKSVREIIDYFRKNILKQFKETLLFELVSNNSLFKHMLFIVTESDFTSIKDLKILYSNNFILLQAKDNNKYNPKFSNNKSNLYNFIKSFNKAFPQDSIDYDTTKDKVLNGLRDVIMNYENNIEKIESSKLYLYITDKPSDKLNMSVSKFYNSCQNLYNGSFNHKLLANVFDENSKLALLIFDTPYTDTKGNKIPYTSIARCIIRYSDDKIMFDKVYPSDMEDVMYKIIEEYTDLKNNSEESDKYKYKHIDSDLPLPYMDKFNLVNIGKSLESKKIKAISEFLNVDTNEINMISENEYEHDDIIYYCMTYDEALEESKDKIIHDIEKEINDLHITFSIQRLLKITNDNFKHYVKENNIELENYTAEKIINLFDLPLREFIDKYISLYKYINANENEDNLINYVYTNYKKIDGFIVVKF